MMRFKFWRLDGVTQDQQTPEELPPVETELDDPVTRDLEIIASSALFDADWYQQTYPDIGGTLADVARHYLEYGAAEGRDPHPLFSTNYYLTEYVDVAESGLNPLIHYIKYGGPERRPPNPLFDVPFYLHQVGDGFPEDANPLLHYLEQGGSERLDPNPFFDTNWYLEQNPDISALQINPLVHYVTIGEPNGLNPSERFDGEWYRRCNIDVARARVSPLRHYLQSGGREGRLPSRAHATIGAVTDAAITCLKKPSCTGAVALFVAHSPDGHLKAHVHHYLESLRQNGVAVILIVATDQPFLDTDQASLRGLDGIFVRQNQGFDFAAWAHILHLCPELFKSETLYFINDSVIGPINEALFTDMIRRIRESPADFIGLADSYESNWHLQSFFLVFKSGALSSAKFHEFVHGIVSLSEKNAVIADYELGLAPELLSANLKCEVLFPQETTYPTNRTLFHWKSLISSGFPFIKVSTIRDGHLQTDAHDWAEVLADHGYDVSIAYRTIGQAQPGMEDIEVSTAVSEPLVSAHSGDADGAQPDFDADFYRTIYPDIADAGVDPLMHYVKYGRAEGRVGRPPEQLDALNDISLIDSSKETILVVSHEGVRGGAPVLAYNIVERLKKTHNVIVLFLSDGPILEDTRELGALVVGPIGLSGSLALAELVVKRICETTAIHLAIVNSIESRYVLPALARLFIPSVSLIHEFPVYIRPRNAFREVVLWSGQVVFSTELTKNDAIAEYPELGGQIYPIIAQGPCILPGSESVGDADRENERLRVRNLLRPKSFPPEGLVIIGAGYVDYRKGVDLFLDCAGRVLKSSPALPLRFAWVGRGYNPETDIAFSVYLAAQLRRHGIEGDVVFVGEVNDLAAVYENADIFVLSSRLDPLPNVAIDALSAGLPLVCFDRTTGIADILARNGLGEQAVAGYLDTEDMARKIIALVRSKALRRQVGLKSATLAKTEFNLDKYVAEIERIGAQQALRARQEQADVDVITRSNLPRLDYYLLPGQRNRPREEVIADYVRSWASGIGRRKLFPGFHPGIYREKHGLEIDHSDPLADYIRAGQPEGPWTSPLIEPVDQREVIPPSVRIALHIHAYHLDVIPRILESLGHNNVRPDLLVSVKSASAKQDMQKQLGSYSGGKVEVRLVPDPGRDVGPFLTEFGDVILDRYDLIGHIHTKTSADLKDSSVASIWVKFLLENVLGSAGNPMADIILGRMAKDPTIGIVYPDDPHPVGWDDNERFVTPYLSNFGLSAFPRNLHVPVGAFFWARPEALRPMFDMKLGWSDYPVEPLPYDGSLLHGLERLYGLSVNHAGFRIFNAYVPGVTR